MQSKNKISLREHCFETLVSRLYCYCGDNVKYRLFSKLLFRRTQHYGCWNNAKRL